MKIAMLGLGAMGSRIAAKLLAASHELTVWNRTLAAAAPLIELGASVARTPREAVQDAQIAIAMLRDDDVSRRVWMAPEDGAIAGLSAGAIAIESSTLSVAFVRELAKAVASRDVAFLDAPVVGSRMQAETGTLIHLIGGEPPTLDQARTVLSSIGAKAHHLGSAGAGTAMKLLVNAALGVQVGMVAELLSAAKAMGLNPARVAEVFGQTPPCSPAARMIANAMVEQNFVPAFPVELMAKDLGYFAAEAGQRELPVSDAARAVFLRALSAGHGAANMTIVIKLYS